MQQLITLAEACERFSISIRTGRRLVRQGVIPASKPARGYLVDPEDVARALAPTLHSAPLKPRTETPSERAARQLAEAGVR